MTKSIPDRLQHVTLISAEEIREKIGKEGELRIKDRNIQGEALEVLHEAIFQGVLVNVERSWIGGDVDFTRGPTVPLEEVEGISNEAKSFLENTRYINALVVISAPIVVDHGTQIQGVVEAGDTFFSDNVSFRNSTFGSPVSFEGACFSYGADFVNARFGWVTFEKAYFGGVAEFGAASFRERADFNYSYFKEGASFDAATFGGPVLFHGAYFGEEAGFAGATFDDLASFYMTAFCDSADYYGSTFKGYAEFVGRKENQLFSGNVDFTVVTFEAPEKALFRCVDLSRAELLETPLDKVRFIDVKWVERDGRRALYDEIGPEKEEKNYALIAHLYRQLKKNYEEARDYPGAGDFHYGEMEMTLKQQKREWEEKSKKWPKFKKWFAWLLTRSYKFLSGYGEKPERAIVIALAILIAGVPFYFFDKLTVVTLQGIWSAFWDGLVSSMGYMTFRLSELPKAWWAKPVVVFQALLGPVQLALLALAIRRRFRR